MATAQHLLLSPAELAYLHSSLSLQPPIRPDGRTSDQFRPLTAETGILPGTNGSARVCFADGTEAIVGVKAEVERTARSPVDAYLDEDQNKMRRRRRGDAANAPASHDDVMSEGEDGDQQDSTAANRDNGDDDDSAIRGSSDWVEMTVEIPNQRDDDSNTIFLATMLSEALLADGHFTKKLWINRRFHWKLYLDIILISPPLSYPLPLLSLTTHLALLATRLPRLTSEEDEDPMFDDDWAASTFIYPNPADRSSSDKKTAASPGSHHRPPITLLVMTVGDNVIFDPSKEELAVADSALAVSVGEIPTAPADAMDLDNSSGSTRNLRLLSVRTIDPPSRLTAPGVPNAVNAAAWGHQQQQPSSAPASSADAEHHDTEGVWKAPRGGQKLGVLAAVVAKVLEKGGVADEVLDGLEGVELS